MKKLLIFSVIFLSYLTVQAQLQGVGTFRIADASTQFGYSIPQGSTVFNIDNGKMYFIRDNIKYDKTINVLQAGTDYVNFLPITGGILSGTLETVDILPYASLTYSLGSSLREWNYIYSNNLHIYSAATFDGDVTVSNIASGGTNYVTETNGKLYYQTKANFIIANDLVIIPNLDDTYIPYYSSATNELLDSPFSTDGTNVSSSGTIMASDFILSSDSTLKKDIKPISLDISKVPIIQFKFKADTTGRERFGVIAQTLIKYAPSLVYTGMDGKLKVAYIGFLVARSAYLEKKVNNMQAQLNDLAKRVKALEDEK